jgi:hypothetical protein
MQLGQHSRAVGARVLADDEDRAGICEIVEQHGPFANPNSFRKTDTGRLVAHVRAIAEIVRAGAAREQLVHKRRLVRDASRGVELGLVWVIESVEFVTDQRDRFLPIDRHIMIGAGIVTHRLGQPPLLFQPVVTFLLQLSDSVGGEELTCYAALGQLPADDLGAILAELERARMPGIRPRAAGAVKVIRLVHRQQCPGAFELDALLARRSCRCPQRTPAGGLYGANTGLSAGSRSGMSMGEEGRGVFAHR